MLKDKTMWNVEYKADIDSQSWTILDTCSTQESALFCAYWIVTKYPMVKVTGPDGSLIWSN